MKTQKYIYLILLSILAVSCKVDSGEWIDSERTVSGKLVYDNSANMLGEHLYAFDFLQGVDFYITTTDPVKKDSIENTLLRDYKIGVTDDGIYTLTGREIWTIKTDNRSLNQIGASWSVSCRYDGTDSDKTVIIPTDALAVTCTSPEKWSMTIDGYRDGAGFIGRASLVIERVEKREQKFHINSDYTMAGKGHLFYQRDDRIMNIDYSTSLPMVYRVDKDIVNREGDSQYRSWPFWFSDGIMSMSVTNSTYPVPESVKADLTSSLGQNRKVKITFKGITEIWWRSQW